MKRDYDATPAHLYYRSRSWYELATNGIKDIQLDFTTERYVAFCFSIEFLLKALICIDKKNAKTDVLAKYGHKMNKAKKAALCTIQDPETRKMINDFFAKYPEFEGRDVIETRYGVLGSMFSYKANSLIDELYPSLLKSADKAIRAEWIWRG